MTDFQTLLIAACKASNGALPLSISETVPMILSDEIRNRLLAASLSPEALAELFLRASAAVENGSVEKLDVLLARALDEAEL